MTDVDELRREISGWRYICRRPLCGYVTKAFRTIELAEHMAGFHIHRHAVGRAGTHARF